MSASRGVLLLACLCVLLLGVAALAATAPAAHATGTIAGQLVDALAGNRQLRPATSLLWVR